PPAPPLPAGGRASVLLVRELPPPANGRAPLGPRLPRLPDLPTGPRPRPLAGPPAGLLGGGAGHPDHLPPHLRLAGLLLRHRHRARLHHLRARVPDRQLRRPV